MKRIKYEIEVTDKYNSTESAVLYVSQEELEVQKEILERLKRIEDKLNQPEGE